MVRSVADAGQTLCRRFPRTPQRTAVVLVSNNLPSEYIFVEDGGRAYLKRGPLFLVVTNGSPKTRMIMKARSPHSGRHKLG